VKFHRLTITAFAEEFARGPQTLFGKGLLLLGVMKQLRNWPTYFADYFGLNKDSFVEYHLRSGMKCRLRARSDDRMIFNDIWLRGVYCREAEIHEGDTVIDIGANIGLFSLLAASRGAKVFSFEPFPGNYQLLLDNLALNGLQHRVFPFNLAVWNQSGLLKLYLSETNESSHSMLALSGESVTVKATTLTDILNVHHIEKCHFLKIDAEGAEYPILYTTPPQTMARIERISLEWHDYSDALRPNYEHNQLKEFLETQGFRVSFKPRLHIFDAIRK
jgi:FkbM family methyltransferase